MTMTMTDGDDYDEEGLYTCEFCGAEECEEDHDMECPNQELHLPKFLAEGATDLSEVVTRYRDLVDHLQERLNAGWILHQQVDNGYLFLALPAQSTKESNTGASST